MGRISNIVRNALRPGYGVEMAHKISTRWRERQSGKEREDVAEWCKDHEKDRSAWAAKLDPDLWKEAERYAIESHLTAEQKLASIGIDLGGGGAYDLLYFLARFLRPSVIVETGVAAGFSSHAFLSALQENGFGTLYSSDFPYFRMKNPERFIGYLVDDFLRRDWKLHILGDRVNLPKIVDDVERIDFLHYDSDKSYEGRSFALSRVGPKLADSALLLFDDIQDNWHFRDFTAGRKFEIFSFEGKWIGMTGGPAKLYSSP